MLSGKIEFKGSTLADVEHAVETALRSIADGNTSGFDRNESGSYTFEIDGLEDLVEPPYGDGDRVLSATEPVGEGTVVGLTDDPRAPYAVAWDDEDVIGGAYAADELRSAEDPS